MEIQREQKRGSSPGKVAKTQIQIKVCQKETVGIDTGRKLKNRTVEEKLAFDPADPPIRTVICKQKCKNYCFANTDARDSLLLVCQAVNKLFSATAII